ncbi:hypothetical protein [Altererythrobacter sp. MF3-039]|uniref:hypothetical protein n=1 Tax=Altererythrobacter sp. MF3-039 TaxID=3252901 RepID=UPI00390CA913
MASLPATAAAKASRADWKNAQRVLSEKEAAYDRYLKTVVEPIEDRLQAIEDDAGIPRMRGFNPQRKRYMDANPRLYRDYHASHEELDRLAEEISDATLVILDTPAPDGAALRWKLNHLLEMDNETLGIWSEDYSRGTIADIDRILGAAS